MFEGGESPKGRGRWTGVTAVVLARVALKAWLSWVTHSQALLLLAPPDLPDVRSQPDPDPPAWQTASPDQRCKFHSSPSLVPVWPERSSPHENQVVSTCPEPQGAGLS